jgi:hypothetical protein
MPLPSSQPLVFAGSRWRAFVPLLLGLPILIVSLCFTASVIYLKHTIGFQLNVVIWCAWPVLVTGAMCLAFSWRVGPVIKPARLTISHFGVELSEGRRSFQLRWEELGDPSFRAIRGQSFIVFGQSYSPGGMIDPILPRVGSMFEARLSKIMIELQRYAPVEPTADLQANGFGGIHPDNDVPIYAVPAFFLFLIAFASAPAFLYWSCNY